MSDPPLTAHPRDLTDAAGQFHLGYRPALDGLRGVSILAVVAFHTGIKGTGGGFLGVNAFFVISGFLITALLLEEYQHTGSISFRKFYARRALRLLPALVALVVVLAVFLLVAPARTRIGLDASDLLYALFYVANWVQALGIEEMSIYVGHTWSLGIEEQFYLLWPALVFLLVSRVRRPWLIVGVVALGMLASGAARSLIYDGSASSWHRASAGLDTRADSLLAGCLIGVLAVYGLLPASRRVRPFVRVAAYGGVAVLGVMTLAMSDRQPFLYDGFGYTVAAVAGALIIVDVLVAGRTLISRILELRPLVWVGRISYALYLWHVPVLFGLHRIVWSGNPFQASPARRMAAALVGVPLSLGLATLSFYAVERPFLRLKTRFTRGRPSTEPLVAPDAQLEPATA